MNRKTVSLIGLVLILCLASSAITYAVTVSLSFNTIIEEGSGVGLTTLFRDGSTYYAKNGLTNEISFSSSNFTSMWLDLLNCFPANTSETILLKSGYYEGHIVIDRDGIVLQGEGVYSDIPVGIPDNSPTVLFGSVIKVTMADVDGISIVGQRYGIQIKDLGIWFTEPSTGCGITTDITQIYTVSHLIIHNIKVLNCDKDSYAIRMANFLHCEVSMVASWGGPLLDIYANKPNFNQGNSLFSELYGYIKYDLSPVDFVDGPYPVFIHRNDSVTTTDTNLLDIRRLQINNPTGCADIDYYTFACWNVKYSSLNDLDFEGSNCQNHTSLLGSCNHLTFNNYYGWEHDPGDAYLAVAANNEYLTFVGSYFENLVDSNYTDMYVNCRVVGTINSDTQANFIGLNGTSGTATFTSGQTSVTVTARFIGPNDYVLITIVDSDALAAGEALKVDTINRAPTNTFVVNCVDEGGISATTTFYWQIVHATP